MENYSNIEIEVSPGRYMLEDVSYDGVQQMIPETVREFAMKEQIRFDNQIRMETHRTEMQIKKELFRSNIDEQRSANRDLAIKKIVQDSEGCFLVERRTPSGECRFSQPICKIRDFKSFRIRSSAIRKDCRELLKITWSGGSEQICFRIDQDDPVNRMIKKFIKKGVIFSFSKRDQEPLAKEVFGFFREHMHKHRTHCIVQYLTVAA